ncbi:MAG: hypothetical protein KAX66_03310 [Propionivibrio sp.]|nr:hypothetical protein [Propionivibrio sp.]
MENWISRIVGTFCALGSIGLFWTLGVFVVVPWRDGRMLALERGEMQVIGVALVLGIATLWGASRIFAAADQKENPRLYAVILIVLIIAAVAALISGVSWTLAQRA